MKRTIFKQLTLRLTAAEYAHVKQLSQDAGLKLEPTIRTLIMGGTLRPRPPEELTVLLQQLSGIRADIDQIARTANNSGCVCKEDLLRISEQQAQLWQSVKRL